MGVQAINNLCCDIAALTAAVLYGLHSYIKYIKIGYSKETKNIDKNIANLDYINKHN